MSGHPVFDWLRANGIERYDIAPLPIVADEVHSKIIYYTVGWDDVTNGDYVCWGNEVIYRQRTAPLVVKPQPGLLEEVARAYRREQLRELIKEIGERL